MPLLKSAIVYRNYVGEKIGNTTLIYNRLITVGAHKCLLLTNLNNKLHVHIESNLVRAKCNIANMFGFDNLYTLLIVTFFLATISGFVGLAAFIALYKFWEGKNAECKCQTRLDGRVAVVTGGNSGIGLETGRDLARRGARVIIASRNTAKSKRAVEDIINTTGNKNVEYRHLDLSKFKSVIRFAEEINSSVEKLDILVNNAGCSKSSPKLTEDGCDLMMQVNYISGFLLTLLLLEKLIASKRSRIVIVSSALHRFGYLNPKDIAGVRSRLDSIGYMNSKLCQVLWVKALAKRLPDGVTVNALHPGVVKTDIFDTFPILITRILKLVIGIVFKDAREGAQTSIHLCVAPELENSTGGYYANCRPAKMSSRAKNDSLVERIWNESLKLTNTNSKNFPLK